MPQLVAVLDDDDAVRQVVTLLLEDEGYAVSPLESGDGAIAAFKVTPPDAIILDLRLQSSLSGWDVLAALEQDCTLRSIPVLVYSAAVGELQDGEACFRARGYGVLPKPFEIDDLLLWVHEHLDARCDSASA